MDIPNLPLRRLRYPSFLAPFTEWPYNRVYLLFLALVFLRVVLFYCTNFSDYVSHRVETSTPFVSAKSLFEGVFFLERGIPLYSGSLVHHPPLLVHFFQLIFRALDRYVTRQSVLFSVLLITDWCIAVVLVRLAMWVQNRHSRTDVWLVSARETVQDSTVPAPVCWDAAVLGCIYLALPFNLLNCLSLTTTAIPNLAALLGLFYCAVSVEDNDRIREGWGLALIAVAGYLSFHHLALFCPAVLFLLPHSASQEPPAKISTYFFKSISFTAVVYVFLHSVAFQLGHDLSSLKETLVTMFMVDDLRPNVGLYWYFFQETFDAYRYVFLYVFHSLSFVFVLPITFRFKRYPLYVSFYVFGLISIWKPYPSVGDIGIFLSLFMAHPELFRYMRYNAVTFSLLTALCFLAPVVYHLWVYWKSGNANYFFGVTLASGLVQTWILSDTLFAQLYRDHEKLNTYMRENKVLLEHVQ